VGQEVRSGALLHDPASLQHDHPVAEAAGHVEVVGHEQQAQAQALLQLLEQVEHIGLHLGVEHAHALIAEQHLRLQDQGAGDGHPLLLASRELAGQAPLEALRGLQAHRRQQGPSPFARFGMAGQAVDQQRVGHRFAHGHLGIEAGQRILEHHLDAAASPAQLGALQAPQVAALQPHGSAPHRGQAHQGAAEAALAAAGGPHQTHRFAFLEAQAHPIHRLEPTRLPGRRG